MDFTVIVDYAGWLVAGIFVLFPILIFGGMFLSRDKKEKSSAEIAEGDTGSKFAKAKSNKNKKSLVVKEGKNVNKEDVAAGVFGFGKSNTFSLPDAGKKASTSNPFGENVEAKPFTAPQVDSKPSFGSTPSMPQSAPQMPVAPPSAPVRPPTAPIQLPARPVLPQQGQAPLPPRTPLLPPPPPPKL